MYGPGVALFREGDPSSAFYIIKWGSVKIVKGHGSGNPKALAILREGDFFGEMGVIEDSPRYASAIVEDEACIIQVKKADFDELMSVNPSIAMKIMVTVTRRYKSNIEAGIEAQPPTTSLQATEQANRMAHMIVFHGSTGGAGVSTIVCNLGFCLKEMGARVLLIDGSTQFGDLSVLLDVIPKQTLYQMAEEEEFSLEVINTNYVNSTKFGFDFIAAPLKPEQSEVVTADLFRVLIDVIRPNYDFILVDTYHLMQEPILTLLEMADEIAYVMSPDLPSMKNARLWLELVKALDFTKANIKVVLNKIIPNSSVNVASVQKNLGVQMLGAVPYDFDLALECVNKGELVVNHPNEDIAKAIISVAEQLNPQGKGKSEEGSFFSGWVGRLTSRFKLSG